MYREFKTDWFSMKTFDFLPCSLAKFRIKGKDAELSDFGSMDDAKSDKAEPYCCACMRFFGDRTPKAGVLAKYGITRKEWTEIKAALKEVMFVGECGFCV